ncbi:TetR/AcrR family transcriptional regulator [Amycolatopsis sp. K13G38]|uniref:TetR/AcrR family transcriptional regulator n=1 Tax=Amycolatopsis acididurans TaxID=2724524 RepID=A0ABX1J174_9PSEU|nr:TetR/AcrR family transcriptional regulator [Amycolatopsis acididurans]NKQ53399.1 TetR/AcrR family transcriptional regulator [Amycolatopsis acididurans]
MSQEQRREMIVRAVLPLVVEHGAAVTTAQIARAAGIGEGTIFRAFKDKDELIQECVLEALRPDDALGLITEIPLEARLETRLAEAADALRAHLDRMGALMASLHQSGQANNLRKRHRGGDRAASVTAMREAVAELFEPDKDTLRLSPQQSAAMFLALLFNRPRDEHTPDVAQLIDVFLHGAVVAR